MRGALGGLLAIVLWVWIRTLRIVVDSSIDLEDSGKGRVFAFFHGQQMALLALRRRAGTAVMVSLSKDGEIQSGVMRRLGFQVVRGSSSRAGARALSGILATLRAGADVAIAVDGPRGPFEVTKPGAAAAAELTGAELFGVASASASALVVERAWDRFEIPWPFTRVAIVVGPAVSALNPSRSEILGAAIHDARARAKAIVEGREAKRPAPLGRRLSS